VNINNYAGMETFAGSSEPKFLPFEQKDSQINFPTVPEKKEHYFSIETE